MKIKFISTIKGFEQYGEDYSVTSNGGIVSYKGKKARVMKPYKIATGYYQVKLFCDGKGKSYYVHRLVLKAFGTFPKNYKEGLHQANHINEVKSTNCIENLNWMLPVENSNHATRNERLSKKVVQLDMNGKVIRVWSSAIKAQRKGGFNHGHISNVCLNKANTHGGYNWEFLADRNRMLSGLKMINNG